MFDSLMALSRDERQNLLMPYFEHKHARRFMREISDLRQHQPEDEKFVNQTEERRHESFNKVFLFSVSFLPLLLFAFTTLI